VLENRWPDYERTRVTVGTSAFNLPDSLARKRDAALTARDEQQFAAIERSLERSIAAAAAQLDTAMRGRGESGGEAVERENELRRLNGRLRALRRYGIDLCLGRMVDADSAEPTYIGRLGLVDEDGARLLLDWRSPAAEPFFGATLANPMGLASRRRYRWTLGRVTDYWDEAFTDDALESGRALDDESAFIASLGSARSPQMRDVLGTIQADQDAIIRAGSRGALVVDGGPGTGKTVVALHRTAYLLYSDPRLNSSDRGVLFVGPSQGYLAYVSDVLPNLGEEGVQICTLRDLLAEGEAAVAERDVAVARIKASNRVGELVEAAVRVYERAPSAGLSIETPWADVWVDEGDWAEAFAAAEPGTTHNEAREQVWDAIVEIVVDQLGDEAPEDAVRRSLAQNAELRSTFNRAWPVLDAAKVVAALWSRPAYLQRCAPWLTADEIAALERAEGSAWTVADLPILDAARTRVGDPDLGRRAREREAAMASAKELMDRVVDDLIAADDSEMQVMAMLRRPDAQNSLVDEAALAPNDPDLLAGPFAHIVVDEAQELTDAEWQMLLRRCPSRSFTVVGDRAQARHGFTESWAERLQRVGLGDVEVAHLSVNYRTPVEVMAEAEPVIRAAIPDANVPTSVRSTVPVRHGSVSELESIVASWLRENEDGLACVIGDASFAPQPRVRSLSPELSKGLEFDLVVLVRPELFGEGIEGAVDRYVAMTRATQELVLLS
jgi:hypothetical protein